MYAVNQDQKPTCLFGACWPMTFITWALVAFRHWCIDSCYSSMNNPVAEVVSFIFTTVIVLIYLLHYFVQDLVIQVFLNGIKTQLMAGHFILVQTVIDHVVLFSVVKVKY